MMQPDVFIHKHITYIRKISKTRNNVEKATAEYGNNSSSNRRVREKYYYITYSFFEQYNDINSVLEIDIL